KPTGNRSSKSRLKPDRKTIPAQAQPVGRSVEDVVVQPHGLLARDVGGNHRSLRRGRRVNQRQQARRARRDFTHGRFGDGPRFRRLFRRGDNAVGPGKPQAEHPAEHGMLLFGNGQIVGDVTLRRRGLDERRDRIALLQTDAGQQRNQSDIQREGNARRSGNGGFRRDRFLDRDRRGGRDQNRGNGHVFDDRGGGDDRVGGLRLSRQNAGGRGGRIGGGDGRNTFVAVAGRPNGGLQGNGGQRQRGGRSGGQAKRRGLAAQCGESEPPRLGLDGGGELLATQLALELLPKLRVRPLETLQTQQGFQGGLAGGIG